MLDFKNFIILQWLIYQHLVTQSLQKYKILVTPQQRTLQKNWEQLDFNIYNFFISLLISFKYGCSPKPTTTKKFNLILDLSFIFYLHYLVTPQGYNSYFIVNQCFGNRKKIHKIFYETFVPKMRNQHDHAHAHTLRFQCFIVSAKSFVFLSAKLRIQMIHIMKNYNQNSYLILLWRN